MANGVVVNNQLVATFTDTAPPEPVANYSASINWGDGTAASAGTITFANGTFSVNGTHTYATPGNFDISIAVSKGSESLSATGTADIAWDE